VNALAPECARRAEIVRAYAVALGESPAGLRLGGAVDRSALAWRLGWDAHAAGEIPRPALADGLGVEELAPELAERAWHAIAGATILGGYCCGTPASHRDDMAELGREIREATR
jgi:hypothetical protein